MQMNIPSFSVEKGEREPVKFFFKDDRENRKSGLFSG
jgi:hypothetical protein